MSERPRALHELRRSGYETVPVREELRRNLLQKLHQGAPTFEGILGYERTVIPAIHNAILAKHDMILLGLRGQAKTRILRALTSFLDEWVPVVEGCQINDSPFQLTCKRCRMLAADRGEELPVDWLHRDDRYREKLATPDVTIADLIGDIDPIKAANRRLEYSDEEVIHYGIIPRTNRGIFAINELPDLAPRIQVGLLNILEERDLQIRGFPVRVALDVLLVFSANPEDYTSRGTIITPLKDRIDSQILTHYPQDIDVSMSITAQEAWIERSSSVDTAIPEIVRRIIEYVAFGARESDLVDQSSGVSARMPISAIEILKSNMERRASRLGSSFEYPRLADLSMILPAITGKVEMVYEGEQQGAEVVAKKLIGEAVLKAYLQRFPAIERAGQSSRRRSGFEDDDSLDGMYRADIIADEPVSEPSGSVQWEPIVEWFRQGNQITLSDEQTFDDYCGEMARVAGLREFVEANVEVESEYERAFMMELVLEALHQTLRLAREDLDSTITFSEAVKFNVLRTVR